MIYVGVITFIYMLKITLEISHEEIYLNFIMFFIGNRYIIFSHVIIISHFSFIIKKNDILGVRFGSNIYFTKSMYTCYSYHIIIWNVRYSF